MHRPREQMNDKVWGRESDRATIKQAKLAETNCRLCIDKGHATTPSHTRGSYLEDPFCNVTKIRNATGWVGRFAGKQLYTMAGIEPMFETRYCY